MRALIQGPLAFWRIVWTSVWLALGQIWAHKLRSVLTTAGIVIGVASVTAVIAALTGLKANVLSEFEALGANKMFVYPSWPSEGKNRRASWRVIRFRPEQFDGLLERCPSVERMTRIGSFESRVRSSAASVDEVEVLGVDPSWLAIEGRELARGRPFDLIDSRDARLHCLIEPSLRDKLRLPIDCVGSTIHVADRAFRIVGLVEESVDASRFGGRGERDRLYVPFTTAWKLRELWFHVVATSRAPEESDEARAEIRFFLRQSRELGFDDGDTFDIRAVEDMIQRFQKVASAITAVAAGIVGISLLVGGIGIMNIMLVSVSERTREIGLRKAVGAGPAAILVQFLVESVTLCLVGGAIGVALGHGLTALIARIPGAELGRAAIPLWAVGLSFGFAAAVGLVFGVFPAIKAARLDPIEALRHE